METERPLTRRQAMVAGGVTLVAIGLTGCRSTSGTNAPSAVAEALLSNPPAAAVPPAAAPVKVTMLNGGTKPVYVPEPGVTDPVAHSLAENLFWTDIFMEHARFFAMLMPTADLAAERRRAEEFQERFAQHLARLQTSGLDRTNFVFANRSTIELVKPFVDFKRSMQDAQSSGRIRSLVWPLFFDHTAREADRALERLGRLNRSVVELDRAEVSRFWTRVMGDHSAFIAHLLDPQEWQTFDRAIAMARNFRALHDQPPAPRGQGAEPLLAVAQEVIDFKTAAERGIETGQLKSIIHPALADHVRREAVKFLDELKRAV